MFFPFLHLVKFMLSQLLSQTLVFFHLLLSTPPVTLINYITVM